MHWLQYLAVQGLAAGMRLLGPRSAYRIAALLGNAWYLIFRRRRAIIHRNLEIAFGGRLDPAARRRIGKLCCRHALATAMDLLVRCRAIRRDNWRQFAAMDTILSEALSSPHPKGLAILSAHIGSWEMGQYLCGVAGTPVSPVMRTLDNPYLNRQSMELRGSFGEEIIPKSGALRGILRILRAGGRVAIMADQNAPVAGEFLPFFKVPAATYIDYARVLARQGCDVLFTVCLREGFQFRFRFQSRLLRIPEAGANREKARALVEDYLAAIEETVAEHPEQFLWMHRRWKRQPPGQPSLYDRPGAARFASLNSEKNIYAQKNNASGLPGT
jgi:KDO2-lipid IV(A) lauroyltransferase